MIKVDENDPVGEVDPSFAFRDVQIRKGEDVKKYYDLEGEIGRGKFGIVYRCKDKETKLVLAAKFVSIAKRQDRKNVEREVEIMKNLRHPRLIQLYDAFENDSTMCVVLEMIEGGELFERVIDDDFVLTEKACTVFMRQICEGVGFIHSNNIIHLDLKPENILCLTKTGNRIKIIDFGLARKFDPDKKLQVLFGTPEFVAPEVVNFDQISCATDMWSVGVICYVLLSGLSPFMGESDIETMSNVTLGKYDFDDDAFDDISVQAKDFISKLLVKNKEKRLTAEEALNHPWLYRKIPPPPPSLETSKDNLKTYMESASNIENNMNNKLSNRKSMLNAIQILADSEKQFAGEKKHFINGGKSAKIIENEPARTENLNDPASLLNSLNSTFSPKIEETVSRVPSDKMVNQIDSNQTSIKNETPSLKRESPLPDTLASLVPINAQICEPIIAQIKSEQSVEENVSKSTSNIENSIKDTTLVENSIKSTPIENSMENTTPLEKSIKTEESIKTITPVENSMDTIENSIKSEVVDNAIKNTNVENSISTINVENSIEHTIAEASPSKNSTPVENLTETTSNVEISTKIAPPVEISTKTPVENMTKNTTNVEISNKITPPFEISTKTPIENMTKNTTNVEIESKNPTISTISTKNTSKVENSTVENLVKTLQNEKSLSENASTKITTDVKNTSVDNSMKMPEPIENSAKNPFVEKTSMKIPSSVKSTTIEKSNFVESRSAEEKIVKNEKFEMPDIERRLSNLQDRLTKLESEHLLQTAQKVIKEKEETSTSETIKDSISKTFNSTEASSTTQMIKTRQNMDILLPKLNESLANMIEMPPPKVHESLPKFSNPKAEKIAQDFHIPTPLSFLESSRTSIPTPLSLLNKESEKSIEEKRNSITELLQNSLGPNLAQKLNLGLFEENSKKESKSPDRTTLGTLNQNPHPKILGITLGHSYEESSSKKSFSTHSTSIKYNSIEESEVKKQKIRKESKFESKEGESVLFKQQLKSIPPWFSETKSLKSSEKEESSWSSQINQLSARLMEITRQSDEEVQSPLNSLLKNTNRRPKMKFSMMNRDVPIGSPPNEGGREFYLNRPFFVIQGEEKSEKSEKSSSSSETYQTVMKIASSEKKENSFLSESTNKVINHKT